MSSATHLDPQRGLIRGVRASVLTVPAVALAALAHTQVDTCVDALALVLAAGICWPAAVALLGSRRQLPTLLAWLTGAQVVTHVLLAQACHEPQRVGGRVLLVHGLAVLVTAVVLHRADDSLWVAQVFRRALGRVLRRLPAVPVVAPATRVRPLRTTARAHRTTWLASPRALRGPPSPALC